MKATPQIVWKQSKSFQKHHGRLLKRFTHLPSFEAQYRCSFLSHRTLSSQYLSYNIRPRQIKERSGDISPTLPAGMVMYR